MVPHDLCRPLAVDAAVVPLKMSPFLRLCPFAVTLSQNVAAAAPTTLREEGKSPATTDHGNRVCGRRKRTAPKWLVDVKSTRIYRFALPKNGIARTNRERERKREERGHTAAPCPDARAAPKCWECTVIARERSRVRQVPRSWASRCVPPVPGGGVKDVRETVGKRTRAARPLSPRHSNRENDRTRMITRHCRLQQ